MSGPRSIFPRLEQVLAGVSKPIQYVGGEHNSVSKNWDDVDVRWALMYPDAYEVGQPNQGVAILYEVLNEKDWILAERTYSVWPDMEAVMRSEGIEQFTLENHLPVSAFDFLGISMSTELGYTNLLTAIDLMGLPLRSAQRDSGPLIVLGGHCSFNPEPVADFVDLVALGDGEEAVITLSGLLRDWRAEGEPGGRDGFLLRAAQTGYYYVPRFYTVHYGANGAITKLTPNQPGVPALVRRHVLTKLDDWPYPKNPLVPMAQTVHERYSVEIFRGCTRGCRFCQAGMITRPVRERSIDTIGSMVEQGLSATGYEEVGLLSLSSADHSEIGEITKELADRYEGTNISLSLPSTRVDAFNIDLANEIARNGRRSGLTFAPEGGSERMRAVINKNVSEEDLIRTITAAFSQGWRNVKLYFMCGLPTETDEDVMAIATMARRVIETGRQISGHRDITCTISIGGFVPKAQTPFQWVGQAPVDVINSRLRMLKDDVRSDRKLGRAINVRYSDGRPGRIEGLLARGDRRVGQVIEAVWKAGGRFDGWNEHFDYELWMRCADEELANFGVDLDWYTVRERPFSEVLPWDHLDAGLDRNWLWEEYEESLKAQELEDCRWIGCNDCGVCPEYGVDIEMGPTGRRLLPLSVVSHQYGRA